MFEKAQNTKPEKKEAGTVQKIKETVEVIRASNPNIKMLDLKKAVAEALPDFNVNTINTQISKILASEDKERPVKQALKSLFETGNLALVGDEAKISQLLTMYNSEMSVDEAVAYLKGKTPKSKGIKVTDLINYEYVEAGSEQAGDLEITFANTVIFARKK